MVIGTDNLIPVLDLIFNILGVIALVLLTSASLWISNKALKNNYYNEQNKIFNEIVKDERGIATEMEGYEDKFNKTRLQKEKMNILINSDVKLFDFYNNLAILLNKDALDFEMFLDYFELKILDVYDAFMESLLFETSKDRYNMYKNLSILFNLMGLSIREKGTID